MSPHCGYLSEISFTEEHLIRVLVVDDFKPWHHFVAAALESDPRYKVVGFASDGSGARQEYSLRMGRPVQKSQTSPPGSGIR